MENQITIREAVTENDAAAFWEQLHAYHKRDIFTDSDKEELEYFLGQAYRDHMMKINGRPQDRCFFLFFHRGGQDIGFAMPVIFTTGTMGWPTGEPRPLENTMTCAPPATMAATEAGSLPGVSMMTRPCLLSTCLA